MTHSMRWQRLQGLVLLLAIAVLAVAALLGGRAIGATMKATASGTESVDINHFAFHPPTLHVKRGAKVAFSNSSDVTHTATSGSFDTKRIAPGTAVTIKFNQKGTFSYHCKIHPFMKGRIVVEQQRGRPAQLTEASSAIASLRLSKTMPSSVRPATSKILWTWSEQP